jgi:hypothetical protein
LFETETFVVEWTAKPNYHFSYYCADRGGVSFDLGMPWYRDGGDPDRFLDEMRQVGMRTEPPVPGRLRRGRTPNRVLQGLALVTLVTGLLVPEDVMQGPLVTCQRRPKHPVPPRETREERRRRLRAWASGFGTPDAHRPHQPRDEETQEPE